MKSFWKFFKSIRLTIWLCVIYILLSLWGSFSLQIDGELYKTIDNEVLFNWLRLTGLPAISKTSWIFLLITIIVFLGINTLVCTIDRLSNIWKRIFNPNLNTQIEFLNSLKFRSEKITEGSPEGIKNDILLKLQKKSYNITISNNGPQTILYADKNRFFALAEVIVHFAFLLLLLGHLITSIYGSKSIDNIAWKNYKAVIPGKNIFIMLHDIDMKFYPSGQPEDFSADIGIIKDNNEVIRKVIKINYPLFYDGNVVYLTNLGYDQSANWPYAILTVNRDPGAKFVLWAGIFFMIGLVGTFFVSYRRIWIFITPLENGQVEIKSGEWVNQVYNPHPFQL